MKKYIRLFLLLGLAANLITACNLEQEVEIELPAYESQYVVECYLEPGKPFGLLLSRSLPYFDPFTGELQDFLEQILVDSAEVSITHNGQTYVLNNGFFLHPDALRLYNYGSFDLVPEDFDNDFVLDIELPSGETYTAHTRIYPKVPFDELVVEKAANDTLYRFLAYFKDPDPERENYFRYTLNIGSLDSLPYHNFLAADRFSGEDRLLFGTQYTFASGDTLIATICHIDKAYYDFFSTVLMAETSNGNPFAQPGGLISNIEGEPPAIGIFTGLNCDRDTLIIP